MPVWRPWLSLRLMAVVWVFGWMVAGSVVAGSETEETFFSGDEAVTVLQSLNPHDKMWEEVR